jgi:hypothetical protein
MNNAQKNVSFKAKKQESEGSSLIEKLSKLVKQDKEKGKTAWTIGKLLSELEEQILIKAVNQNSDEEFEDFVAENLGLSRPQIETRMAIHRWISDSNLITKRMAIGHLEQVIRLKDEDAIKSVLNILAEYEKENQEKDLLYTETIIGSVVNEYKEYVKKEKSNNEQNDFSLFLNGDRGEDNNQRVTDFSFEDSFDRNNSNYKLKNERTRNRRADIWGRDIESGKFPEITNFYAKEPIDEQGLVGLFCTIFPIIKNKDITIDSSACEKILGFTKNQELKFSKIKGIRQRFPDGIIEFFVYHKNSITPRTTELYSLSRISEIHS